VASVELGRILEEEALSRKIQEVGLPQVLEEKDRISRVYSWCSRRGDAELCSEFEKALTDAVRSLARLRIFKALMGIDPGKSFDAEALRSISRVVETICEVIKSSPSDPYGRIPIRSKVDLEGEGLSLRRGYVYMVHMDKAIVLVASGLAELVTI